MRTTPAASGGTRTPAGSRLPDLRIVPSAALLLHEEYDPERVQRLGRSLPEDGVLRNPPIGAALDDRQFVVLDGANRATALSRAGMPHQLMQVVDYDDPAVALDVWAHLLLEDAGLGTQTAQSGTWRAMPVDALRAGLDDGLLLCGLITPQGARGLPVQGGIAERVRMMRDLVTTYKGRGPVYRVQAAGVEDLERAYGPAAALVVFARLTKDDVRAIARLPVKLPAGISRHVVPQRALRVNLELSILQSAEPVEVKQARLDEMIRARLREHRVRHYPEATVLYDE